MDSYGLTDWNVNDLSFEKKKALKSPKHLSIL